MKKHALSAILGASLAVSAAILLRRPVNIFIGVGNEGDSDGDGGQPAPCDLDPCPDDPEGLWAKGPVFCLICQNRWIATYPASADPEQLSCPNCDHQMTMPE